MNAYAGPRKSCELGKEVSLAESRETEIQFRTCWEPIALWSQVSNPLGLIQSILWERKRSFYFSVPIANRLRKYISVIPFADKYTAEKAEYSNWDLPEEGHVH